MLQLLGSFVHWLLITSNRCRLTSSICSLSLHLHTHWTHLTIQSIPFPCRLTMPWCDACSPLFSLDVSYPDCIQLGLRTQLITRLDVSRRLGVWDNVVWAGRRWRWRRLAPSAGGDDIDWYGRRRRGAASTSTSALPPASRSVTLSLWQPDEQRCRATTWTDPATAQALARVLLQQCPA